MFVHQAGREVHSRLIRCPLRSTRMPTSVMCELLEERMPQTIRDWIKDGAISAALEVREHFSG